MARIPYPLAQLPMYSVNRGPFRPASFVRPRGISPSGGNRIIRLGALGDDGDILYQTPDQQAASYASEIAPTVAQVVAQGQYSPSDSDLADAIALINTNIPQVPIQTNLPTPGQNGQGVVYASAADAAAAAGLSGVSRQMGYRRRFTGSSRLGDTNQLIAQGADVAAYSLAAYAGLGALAGPIGAAVGLVVGIIAGLFAKKVSSPPTTQAQVAQAQSFIQQYQRVAGTCIGRAYPDTTIQDVAMAFCINALVEYGNAGGCQNQQGILNTWNEQQVRLNAFFTALAGSNKGDTITLRDISSLPGHGKTNMNVSFTFVNPGVSSPNYILGPYYAQYFFTMCNIFSTAGDCVGEHLTAPVPQFYCDMIDWYRAKYPAWDIPLGSVVNADVAAGALSVPGVDDDVEYQTVSLQPGQVNSPAATALLPALTLPAVTASGGPVNADEEGGSLSIAAPGPTAGTGGAVDSGGTIVSNPPNSTAAQIYQNPSGVNTGLIGAGGGAVQTGAGSSASNFAASLGLTETQLLLIAGVALILVMRE